MKFFRSLIFEKAYAQYRLNQTVTALATISSSDDLSNKNKELKAQILYRLERYMHRHVWGSHGPIHNI